MEGMRTAIKPWQHFTLLSELDRALGTALGADRLETQTFPLQDGQSVYLQT
jgi:hypothetical protein